MYTNPQYLRITNLKERGAAVAILAAIGKLNEKGRLSSGATLCIKERSPRFTRSAQRFLTNNLRAGFKGITLVFVEKAGAIIATVTPK